MVDEAGRCDLQNLFRVVSVSDSDVTDRHPRALLMSILTLTREKSSLNLHYC